VVLGVSFDLADVADEDGATIDVGLEHYIVLSDRTI
jgi:hypothetical protein